MKTSVASGVMFVLTFLCCGTLEVVSAHFDSFCESFGAQSFWTQNSELLCGLCCDAEALGGELPPMPSFCETLCPDYIVPEEFMNPNATCTKCPEPDCYECFCTDGTCLEATHGFPDENSLAGVPGGIVKDKGFADGLVAPAAGKSATSFYCSYCIPQRKCRYFWFCR